MLWCGFSYTTPFCCEKNSDPEQKDTIHAQIRQKQNLSHTWVYFYFLTNSRQRTQSI